MKASNVGVSDAGKVHNRITKDLDLMERMRRAERNERTAENADGLPSD